MINGCTPVKFNVFLKIEFSEDKDAEASKVVIENNGEVVYKDKLPYGYYKEEATWFYMWGGRGYHMSGQGTDKPGKLNAIQRHSAHIEMERTMRKIPTGNVHLNPCWEKNYTQMLKDFLAH